MRGETSPEKTQSLYTARLKRTHRPHFMYVCVWKRARVWLKFFKCTFCVCMWTSIVWNDCQMCCSGNEQYCESDMQTVRTDQSTCLIGAKPQEQVCLLYCVTLQPDHWLILFVCLFTQSFDEIFNLWIKSSRWEMNMWHSLLCLNEDVSISCLCLTYSQSQHEIKINHLY